jgi:pimeloyl-ACP methyl ester carboxylesterase
LGKISGAYGYEIRGAGHIPQVETVEEFNAVMLDFLNGS